MVCLKLTFNHITEITKKFAQSIAIFNGMYVKYNNDCSIETKSRIRRLRKIVIRKKTYFDFFPDNLDVWEKLPNVGLFKIEVIPKEARGFYRIKVDRELDRNHKVKSWIFRLEKVGVK